MNRLKSKNEQKYFNRVAKHVISSKNKYFRRNLHINHNETNIRILRIKNNEQFHYEIEGFKTMPQFECFFIYHKSVLTIEDKYFNVRDSEVILTDSKTNKVIAINKVLKNYPDFFNVWIVKKNTVDYFKITIGDIVFTR